MQKAQIKSAVLSVLAMGVAALVVVYLAGTDFNTQRNSGDSKSGSNSESSEDAPQIEMVSLNPDAFVLLEAEKAEVIEAPVVVAEDIEDASFGKCCYLGPEKVNEKPETAQYKKGYDGAPHPGFAQVKFVSPESAAYAVYVRVKWSDDCGDSLDVAIDGKFLGTVQGNASGVEPRWQWLRAGGAVQLSRFLEAGGEHTIEICNREDDLYFDQIILVDSEVDYVPSGIVNEEEEF